MIPAVILDLDQSGVGRLRHFQLNLQPGGDLRMAQA